MNDPTRPFYDGPLHMMEKIGGSFAKAIAHAYYMADSTNKTKLLAAFPDLFVKYEQMYMDYKSQEQRP